MIYEEFTWKNAEKIDIFACGWRPDSYQKAVVVLVHGLGEHSGRYQHVGEFLCEHGYALFGLDLPGHGKSGGIRGHADFDSILLDIDHLIATVKARFPAAPIILYGHSMGGTLALYYLYHRKPDIKGSVVTSPGLRTGFKVPPIKLALARMMNRWMPTLVMANGLDQAQLARDPSVRQKYAEDPLVHDRISARLGWNLISKGEELLGLAGSFPSMSILMMVGTEDRLVSPQAVYEFAERYRGDLTLKKWEGFLHETHNEIGKEAVLNTMVEWMSA